ncbi:MAG: c-type cytochrome [Granulicella sp.]
MKTGSMTLALFFSALCIAAVGCNHAPGKPTQNAEAARPDEVLDFSTLYKQNCAACHGEQGKAGMAVSLANPVYLAVSGEQNLQQVAAVGIPGTLMPPFGRKSGGMLTDRQIGILAHGIVAEWGQPGILTGSKVPGYASSLSADVAHGQQAFATFCARCHGSDGAGMKTSDGRQSGSIVDPAYLALVSDQNLRTTILAGLPEQHMPDFRSDLTGTGARPMTDQEITDVVAWVAAHRTTNPGQPYQQHP